MSMKIVITTGALLAALAGQALAQDFSHITERFAIRPAERADSGRRTERSSKIDEGSLGYSPR